MFKKKAEIISVIFLIIVGLVALILFFQQEPVILNYDLGNSEKLINEVELNVERAIESSIIEFLNNGFSDLENGNVWYCNMQYPSTYEGESYIALKNYLTVNINSVISVLEENGYDVEFPKISILNNETDISKLKKEDLQIELADFYVTSTGSNVVIREDLSKVYNIEWPVLEMYSVFYNWTAHDAGYMEQTFKELLFEEKACQAIISDCNCANVGVPSDTKKQLKISSQDVFNVMDDYVIRKLELQFDTNSIECSFDFEQLKIENEEYSAYVESESSIYANKVGILDKDPDKYRYDYGEYNIQYAFPDSSELNNYGCPIDFGEAAAKGSSYPGVVRNPAPTSAMQELDPITFSEGLINNYEEINFSYYELVYMGESCQDFEEEVPTQKSELYAVNKKLAFLVNVYCEDKSIQLDSGDYLRAEVKARLAIGETCPIPYEENVNTFDKESICLDVGGGGGGGAGSCSVEDPCNPCETCVGANSFGIGVCEPLPFGTPTNVTCEICDGLGNVTAAPSNMTCDGLCHTCNGVDTGFDACVPATAENGLYNESNPIMCNGETPCAVCDQNATCNGVAPAEFYENNVVDSSVCADCESCGINALGLPACVPNLDDDGDFVSGRECKVCLNGTVVPAPVGAVDPKVCSTCEVCNTAGECGYEPGVTETITGVCAECQTCGPSGGSAACVADTSQNGNVCGSTRNGDINCKVCGDGVCIGDTNKIGDVCRTTNRGCEFICGATGSCNQVSNLDALCSRIYPPPEGLECLLGNEYGVCNSGGFCVRQILPEMPEGKKCCGDKICDASDDCCDLGSEWICGSCEDETT